MTNNAFIYRRPSKWPIATALTAAVLIHLSAVAIAFHQESPAILPAATDPTTIGVYFADDPPTPPDPDISVPPPGPVPAADFIEPQETRRRDQNATDPRSHWAIRANTASGSGKSEGVRAYRAAAGLPIRSAQPPYYRERHRRDHCGSQQRAGRGCRDGAKHR